MSQYKSSGRRFDEAATEYDEVRPGYPKELIEDILLISSIPSGARILEIGCGSGQATIPFAQRGYSILCLDVGKKLVEIAREKFKKYSNVEVHNISFEDWKPEKSAFDLLISATAFHWISPEIGYTKAAEVLKDTGWIALFWNMHPTPYTGFFEDVQSVYKRVVPDWVDPRDGPDIEKKIRERESHIGRTGLFEKVLVKRYSWSRTYSTDQYLKLLDTYSDHRSLRKRERNDLYAGIRELIEKKYRGEVVRPYLSVLYMAKKRT